MTNITANKFCSHCGNALIETAVICPKCGSPTPRFNQLNQPGIGNQVVRADQPKSKSVAVVLAIFLGIWSFLYTYKKDAVAFWVGLGLQMFLTFGTLSSPASSGSEGAIIAIGLTFGLVAFIVAVSRSSEWYQRYPNN